MASTTETGHAKMQRPSKTSLASAQATEQLTIHQKQL